METTTLNLFYIMLALTVCIVLLPLTYLRKITRQVLLELCDRDGTGAEFWLRTADVLAIAGSLILVLLFGRTTADPVEAVRMTLIMALAGVFVTVMFVASNIWRQATRVANRAVVAEPVVIGSNVEA
jgi:hypothetical protein